jgi:WXG100 family type VII secretion target
MTTLRTSPQGPGGAASAGSGGPAGGGFQTDLDVMDSARGYVEHVGGTMISTVNRMMGALEALNPSTWNTPAASQAFVNAKLQWQTAHQHLSKSLAEIEMGLDDSRKQYDQSDNDSQLGITNAVRGLPF